MRRARHAQRRWICWTSDRALPRTAHATQRRLLESSRSSVASKLVSNSRPYRSRRRGGCQRRAASPSPTSAQPRGRAPRRPTSSPVVTALMRRGSPQPRSYAVNARSTQRKRARCGPRRCGVARHDLVPTPSTLTSTQRKRAHCRTRRRGCSMHASAHDGATARPRGLTIHHISRTALFLPMENSVPGTGPGDGWPDRSLSWRWKRVASGLPVWSPRTDQSYDRRQPRGRARPRFGARDVRTFAARPFRTSRPDSVVPPRWLRRAKPALGGTRAHRPEAEHAGRTPPHLRGGNSSPVCQAGKGAALTVTEHPTGYDVTPASGTARPRST